MPNSEKGFAPIAIIAVVLVVAVAGYFVFSKSGSGGGSSLPGVPAGVTLNPNCKLNDPDLCKFTNNFKEIKDYSVKSTTTAKGQPTTEMLVETQGDNKSHMVMTTDGKEAMNTITIDQTTYTKDYTDNKWWKQVAPKETSQPEVMKDETNIKDEITTQEDKTTYKKIGKEACGSMQCFKYQVISPDNTDSTEYIYFDDRDYQLRKTRSEGKDGTISEAEYAYSGVNVSVPSPTKDAKPDQMINPYSAGAAMPGVSAQDQADMQKAMDDAKNAMNNPAAPTQDDNSSDYGSNGQ